MMTMMMEAADQEAVMGFKDQSQMMIIKGKRTKRQRLASPLAVVTATSSSSSSAGHDHDHQHQGLVGPIVIRTDDVGPAETSPATSADQFTEISTEEEEDMANCLILLAQGNSTPKVQNPILGNNNRASGSAAAGLYVYQCKTCDRCFPSFQALGGHRASHKKPNKANMNSTHEKKKALSFMEESEEFDRFNNTSTTLSLQISNRAFQAVSNATTTPPNCNNNKTNKIHECSVCGAEFTSGQALGGHMRRHRTFINTTTTTTTTTMTSSPQSQSGSKRPRNVLQLDLNLPAPEEDRIETKFPFGSKKEQLQVIVFSASPLVGCHY